MIDHAVLHPTHGVAELRAACELCAGLRVASVCVKPSYVRQAADLLEGTGVAPSTVIGFPHGGTSIAAKVAETHAACRDGAREVDMVVNLGRVFSGDWEFVLADIRSVVEAANDAGALTKVIFETGLLPSDAEKTKLCNLSEQAGAAFVKTSTGFGMVKDPSGGMVATGATEHDIALMRRVCSPHIGVKASGGIRSLADAQRLVALGATRLGTSATQAIAAGELSDASY